jgi:ureidoacrylate peracid hydrolase
MKLLAKPEPLEVNFAKSAVVVVDMQNAFASKGGMLDIAGFDISGAPAVVRTIQDILKGARGAGVPVVYLQMGFKADLSDGGGAASPNPKKELALCLMNGRPELRGKLLVEGTWDFAIVDQLKPQREDLVIRKTRYSGFVNTPLDAELRARGIQYLWFTGIATNVCVESTLRDAFFLDYWPILMADATMHAGPPSQQEATLFNVEKYFGWIADSKEFLAKCPAGGARILV